MVIGPTGGGQKPTSALVATQRSTAYGARGDDSIQNLTPGDFELAHQATGRRIDKNSEVIPLFAAQIGMDRRNGTLPGGAPVTEAYLKDLMRLYEGKPGGTSDQAGLALQYLTEGRARGRALSS